MFNKSIAYRLSIYVSLAVVGVFLTFILVAYYFNFNILRDNIEEEAKGLGIQALNNCEKQLVMTREHTHEIAEDIARFLEEDEINQLLINALQRHQNFNAIHVDIDKSLTGLDYHNYFVYRENDTAKITHNNEVVCHCHHETEIFEKAKANEKPCWTEAFHCVRNDEYVVSYYVPIKIKDANNQLITIGSVITELSLNELIETIDLLKPGQSGYALLVSAEGTYLSHPNKSQILTKSILDFSPKEYNADPDSIKARLKKGETGSLIAYPEFMNYEKCWIYYIALKETGWTLIFVIPYNELFVPFYLLVLRMLFFSVLGILAIFFIVTFITNKQIQPLSNITSQLKKFSSTNGDLEINTSNEVELVSASLDYLKEWYERFKLNKHQEEKLNNQRVRDLEEASEIQMSLINSDFSPFSEKTDIDIYAVYKPARVVSGDLYDFYKLDGDNLFFHTGDVSGKGVSAAFFMSVAQTLLKKTVSLQSPSNIVYNTNNELHTVNQHQFFLTLFAGVLNLKSGVLTYCNAAHTSPIILKSNGKITELNQQHGMPLGLYPNRHYGENEIKLSKGDSVILYSDGVTEQLNADGKLSGFDRLINVVKHAGNLKPREITKIIEESLVEFRGDVNQTDDITIMVIRFQPQQ